MKKISILFVLILATVFISCRKMYYVNEESKKIDSSLVENKMVFSIKDFDVYNCAIYRNYFGDNPNEILEEGSTDANTHLVSLRYLALHKNENYFLYITFVPTRYMSFSSFIMNGNQEKRKPGNRNYLDNYLDPIYKEQINIAWIDEFILGRVISDSLLDFRFRDNPTIISFEKIEKTILFQNVTTFEKKLTKQNNLQEKIKREAITFKLMDTTSTPTFSFAFFNQYTDVPLKVEDSFKIYQEKGKNRIYFEFEDLYKVDGNEYKTLTYKKKKFNERFDFLYY